MHYDQSIKIYGQLSKYGSLEYTTYIMEIKFSWCSQKIEVIFGHEKGKHIPQKGKQNIKKENNTPKFGITCRVVFAFSF